MLFRALGLPRANFAPEGGNVTIDDALNTALTLLDGDPDARAGATDVVGDEAQAERIAANLGGETLPADAQDDAGDTGAEGEPAGKAEAPSVPAIDPPVSWKADEKDAFKALPRNLQQTVADAERRREAEFTRVHQEAAEHRKAIEAERIGRNDDRQAHARQLGAFLDIAIATNPVLADAARLSGNSGNLLIGPGWDKLRAENRQAYDDLRVRVEQTLWQVQRLHQEKTGAEARTAEDTAKARTQRQAQAHKALMDELKLDTPAQWAAFDAEMSRYLIERGADPKLVANVLGELGAWPILVAYDALRYRKLVAQEAGIAARKRPAPQRPVRVIRPEAGRGDRNVEESDRARRMRTAIKGAGNTREIAEVIAGHL